MGIEDRDYYRDSPRPPVPGADCPVLATVVITLISLWVAALLVPHVTAQLGLRPGLALREGEAWRVVSSAWIHGRDALFSLLAAVALLVALGGDVERALGSGRFAVLMGAAAVAAGGGAEVVGAFWASPGVLAGAAPLVLAILSFRATREAGAILSLFNLIPCPAWLLPFLYVVADLGLSGARAFGPGALAWYAGGGLMGWGAAWWWAGARGEARSAPRGPQRAPRADILARTAAELPDRGPGGGDPPSRLDLLLDKIHRHGRSALTDAEAAELEAESRRLRDVRARRDG